MHQPKVSVITACYNGARFINDWADSLLRQTWDNVEIFFVNDGSTDDSEAKFFAIRSKLETRDLYEHSNRYIFMCEYYNPTPVTVPYRGFTDRIFKRDFAGELMDCHPDVQLVDYGFFYHRDKFFPEDDSNWFLMEKR